MSTVPNTAGIVRSKLRTCRVLRPGLAQEKVARARFTAADIKTNTCAAPLASWTIGYGLVQGLAPMVLRRSADGLSREIPEARL